MTPADEEFLDALGDEIEDLHGALPHDQLAETLVAEAEQMEPGARGRAALLSHAGEKCELANRPELARTCYERAIDDGGIAAGGAVDRGPRRACPRRPGARLRRRDP